MTRLVRFALALQAPAPLLRLPEVTLAAADGVHLAAYRSGPVHPGRAEAARPTPRGSGLSSSRVHWRKARNHCNCIPFNISCQLNCGLFDIDYASNLAGSIVTRT